jgi:acyl-CoA thioesterase-1
VLVGMQIPPNYGPRYTNRFRDIYKELAEKFELPLVEFLLEDVATDAALMQRDGIHPTAAAQEKILDNVWPVLQPLLVRG